SIAQQEEASELPQQADIVASKSSAQPASQPMLTGLVTPAAAQLEEDQPASLSTSSEHAEVGQMETDKLESAMKKEPEMNEETTSKASPGAKGQPVPGAPKIPRSVLGAGRPIGGSGARPSFSPGRPVLPGSTPPPVFKSRTPVEYEYSTP